MKAKLPKNFVKLANHPTREGLESNIIRYYCGSNPEWCETSQGSGVWDLIGSKGKLSTCVIQTPKGFYFGYHE